jgi:hypothetical protein
MGVTEYLTAFPIVPARDIGAATAWSVTFFEPPAGYDPREGGE